MQHTRLNRSVARNIQQAPIQVHYQPRQSDLAESNIRPYQPPQQQVMRHPRVQQQYQPPQGIIQQPQVQLGQVIGRLPSQQLH